MTVIDRRQARRLALELLYGREITGFSLKRLAKDRLQDPEAEPLAEFCGLLLRGIEKYQERIDRTIDEYAQNWALERLPLIDRNILRMAIYEMIYEPTIPISVSINEAVELSKEYGSADSSKFVNGVLGQLAVNLTEPNGRSSSGDKEL